RRGPEVRPRCVSGDGREVHGTPAHTALTVVAHVPDESSPTDRGRRLLCGGDCDVPARFVLVILAHERRHVVHLAVTDEPTAAWTAQQLREAFPWNEAPRFLVHDRDSAFYAWDDDRVGDRHRGNCHGSAVTLAERLRGALDRIHSPRVPRSHHHHERARIA